MDPRELLAIKRDGGALSPDQSAEFLSAYTRGEIADYQAAVLLTSIFIHDMTDAELAGWARGMIIHVGPRPPTPSIPKFESC